MTSPAAIHGTCDDRWTTVREAFEENFAEDLEDGASLCVNHEGQNVLDLWGGERTTNGDPWEADTIVNVASTTKIMVTLCALMQVERGLLDLDEKVTHYWPEFGRGGKESATLRHVFTHRAGVPGLKTPVASRTLGDWGAVIRFIEQEPAWWPPGTICCYHALHYGHLLGELIRRTSGKRTREFFQHEVASRLGADFSIGVREKRDIPRLAALSLPNLTEGLTEIQAQVFNSYSVEREEPSWATMSRDAPSTNGWGNGRSIARVAAVFANGGTLDGIKFLSPELIAEAASEQYCGEETFYETIRLGLFFGLDSPGYPAPTPTAFHWGGAGGSWCVMDPACRVSVAYAMNRGAAVHRSVDPRQKRIWKAIGPIMRDLSGD